MLASKRGLTAQKERGRILVAGACKSAAATPLSDELPGTVEERNFMKQMGKG